MKLIRDDLDIEIDHSRLGFANPEQYKFLLIQKLEEEIQELKDSNFEDPNEYGDVIEVIYALAEEFVKGGVPTIEDARILKLLNLGGFKNGLVLLK